MSAGWRRVSSAASSRGNTSLGPGGGSRARPSTVSVGPSLWGGRTGSSGRRLSPSPRQTGRPRPASPCPSLGPRRPLRFAPSRPQIAPYEMSLIGNTIDKSYFERNIAILENVLQFLAQCICRNLQVIAVL